MSLLGLALGLSAAGTAVGTGVNMYENQKNRSFNAEQADLARIYNLYMDNTKYQRAVKDMQKAGLNPAMLFSGAGGGGASTPNSAVASASGSSNVFANTINAAANFAAAFNMDRNPKNDVTTKQVFDSLGNLQKTIYSENTKY